MDMHMRSVAEPIGPDSAKQTILEQHPWASRWVIQVSSGLVNIVSDLLADFESMLGKPPELAFLRITDELENNGSRHDLASLYQRKLRVFAQAQEAIDARDQALLHVIRNAVQASLTICCVCGDELETHDISDDDERLAYPFLPKAPSSRNGLFVSSILVCMRCSENQWLEEQQKEEELAALPANANPADLPDGKKPPDALTRATNKIKSEIEYDEFEDADEGVEDDEWNEENDDEMMAIAAPLRVAVFDLEEVDQLERAYADATRDQANRIKGLVKKIRGASAHKLLVTIPADWRDYCEELTERFPNFAEVTAFIRNQLALSEAGDQVLRIPPFMLVGGPGIGKTEYALTIASDFRTKLTVIDVSNAQTGSALTGSESFWSNSQPGALFNALMTGEMANPIVMLDEIDKARPGHSGYNPLAALHQLLEPRQARAFHDLSVPELNIDASHVLWMATANNLEGLDQPIIDRFTVFHISDPSSEQMPAIVNNQYRRFIDKHPSGQVFEDAIRDDVLGELCKHHPRKVRKLLEQSFGLAAFDKRSYLTVADIKASDTGAGRKKAGIGFLAADIN
jgi:hypothetical protein